MMTEAADIETMAGEYVLGTLEGDVRAQIDRRRLREPELNAAIVAWERRFAPLLETVPSVAPPLATFDKILLRLSPDPTLAAEKPPSVDRKLVPMLERRVARWRRSTAAISALAACLAGFIILRETSLLPLPQFERQNVVGVFQKDDGRPTFLLTVDLKTRQVLIKPLNAEALAGKSYQLWIVDPELGPAPRSLGLLNAQLEPTRKQLPEIDSAVLKRATFGISVEPEGGSPTGRPTGPALHSKLYPTSL